MLPKIFRIILPVNDIEKAEKFYRNLFGDSGYRVSSGRHYFNCCGVILTCYDSEADGDDVPFSPNPEHIYFSVDNIDRFFVNAKNAGFRNIDPEITIQPWGERSFYCIDPFGNPLCFVDENTIFTGEEK